MDTTFSLPTSPAALPWADDQTPETDLIQQAQRGSLNAFNSLVLLYQDAVYRQAFWMLKEPEAAEDAAQEAFLKAFRNIHNFMAGKPFRPWLLRITTNHCMDLLRKAQRHPMVPYEMNTVDGEEVEACWMRDPSATPEQMMEQAELERSVKAAILRLAPASRAVVVMADVLELDYAEIAAILNLPLGTIKSRLCRARRSLREVLGRTREPFNTACVAE